MTSPLRVLIADDEPAARRTIQLLLAGDPEIQVLGECGDGFQAVEAILSLHPDLVFLDVQMPRRDGFEVLARRVWALHPNLTAYDAAYVALAEELGAPLLTLDARLARAPGPTCRFLLPQPPGT